MGRVSGRNVWSRYNGPFDRPHTRQPKRSLRKEDIIDISKATSPSSLINQNNKYCSKKINGALSIKYTYSQGGGGVIYNYIL